METTLALIKPDAVSKGLAGMVLSRMEASFEVADVVCARWMPSLVGQFYAEHKDKPFWNDLIDFMSSDRMYACTLVGVDAVARWRVMMGATDPRLAEPGTIRDVFGDKYGIIMRNAVHGSDSVKRAREEIGIIRNCLRVKDNLGPGMSLFGDNAAEITLQMKRRG